MVFDWFKRAVAPQSPPPVSPPPAAEPPAPGEFAPEPSPEGSVPGEGSAPSPSSGSGFSGAELSGAELNGAALVVTESVPVEAAAAGAETTATASAEPVPGESAAPQVASAVDGAAVVADQPPAVGAVDQDALDWARQAYARLKAQQEAARSAPVPEPIPSPPASGPAVTESLPAGPSSVAVEPTVPGDQPAAAEQLAVAEIGAAAEPTALFQQMPAAENPLRTEPTAPDPAPAEPPTPLAAAAVVAEPGFSSGAELPAIATLSEPAFAVPPAPLPAVVQAEQSPTAAPVAAAGLSLLEQAAAQRQQRLQQLTAAAPVSERELSAEAAAPPVPAPALAESEPQLGEFDDTFTWSAEVLAAQGRQVEDMSLEEIDWLGRLRRGLEKTRRGFVTQLLENLGDDPLTPQVLDDLETTLLRADVGVQATDQVLDALRRRLNEEVVEPAEGLRFLKEQLRGLLEAPIAASAAPLLAPQRERLNVWLLVGVNGVGKTTTLGKLANLAVRSGYSCLIAAADTFRAAAVEQVSIWGQRSGVPVISNPSANADPAAVVYDAIGAARAKGTELVLVDTAGRLQTKHNLMEELTKVRRIIDKLAPEAVVESLLVLDASQGQNGLRQAMAFASAAGLTGVVITKLDGSARGGVALAVASEAKLPIRFIGAGEGIRDLRPFNSFEFVEALLAR